MSTYQQSIDFIYNLTAYAPPLILAITVHEASHGFVANLLGDDTAKVSGRMTLNPLKHIDPIGTIFIPLALYLNYLFLSGGTFIFGWAKAIPVTQSRLRHPKRDFALVSAAGPISNIIMALFWGLIAIFLMDTLPGSTAEFISFSVKNLSIQDAYASSFPILSVMANAGIWINLILAAINLLPIPPLDGANILSCFLSKRVHALYISLSSLGFWIVIALLITGYLSIYIRFAMISLMSLIFFLCSKIVLLISAIPSI